MFPSPFRPLPLADAAAPTGSNTTVIFDSTKQGCRLSDLGVCRVSFGVKNSHVGTLKEYASRDGGATWDQVRGDIAVGAAPATDISGPYDYPVDVYCDWKLEWVNGGTNQNPWRPHLIGHPDRVKAT